MILVRIDDGVLLGDVFSMKSPHKPSIPLLDVCPKKKVYSDKCLKTMFTAPPFTEVIWRASQVSINRKRINKM